MTEYLIIGSFLALFAIAVAAHSPTVWVRALGLGGLGLVTAALLGGAGFLLWGAFIGPSANSGFGNFGMALLALPLLLFGFFAGFFLREAWRYVPGVSPHRPTLAKLWDIVKILRGGS